MKQRFTLEALSHIAAMFWPSFTAPKLACELASHTSRTFLEAARFPRASVRDADQPPLPCGPKHIQRVARRQTCFIHE